MPYQHLVIMWPLMPLLQQNSFGATVLLHPNFCWFTKSQQISFALWGSRANFSQVNFPSVSTPNTSSAALSGCNVTYKQPWHKEIAQAQSQQDDEVQQQQDDEERRLREQAPCCTSRTVCSASTKHGCRVVPSSLSPAGWLPLRLCLRFALSTCISTAFSSSLVLWFSGSLVLGLSVSLFLCVLMS